MASYTTTLSVNHYSRSAGCCTVMVMFMVCNDRRYLVMQNLKYDKQTDKQTVQV